MVSQTPLDRKSTSLFSHYLFEGNINLIESCICPFLPAKLLIMPTTLLKLVILLFLFDPEKLFYLKMILNQILYGEKKEETDRNK